MGNKENLDVVSAPVVRKKMTMKERVNHLTTVASVLAVPVVVTVAHAADDIDVGSLALTGLGTAAATVFTIKASPSLMMWGYRKILGFIGR